MLFRSFISFGEAFGVSVVIVGDTLKLFHSCNAFFYKRYSSHLQSLHVLVFDGILLHFFSLGTCSDEFSHMLVDNEDFVNGSTSEIAGTVTLTASYSLAGIRNIVTYELDLSFRKRLDP